MVIVLFYGHILYLFWLGSRYRALLVVVVVVFVIVFAFIFGTVLLREFEYICIAQFH